MAFRRIRPTVTQETERDVERSQILVLEKKNKRAQLNEDQIT